MGFGVARDDRIADVRLVHVLLGGLEADLLTFMACAVREVKDSQIDISDATSWSNRDLYFSKWRSKPADPFNPDGSGGRMFASGPVAVSVTRAVDAALAAVEEVERLMSIHDAHSELVATESRSGAHGTGGLGRTRAAGYQSFPGFPARSAKASICTSAASLLTP